MIIHTRIRLNPWFVGMLATSLLIWLAGFILVWAIFR
jgi:hypothetical protein